MIEGEQGNPLDFAVGCARQRESTLGRDELAGVGKLGQLRGAPTICKCRHHVGERCELLVL